MKLVKNLKYPVSIPFFSLIIAYFFLIDSVAFAQSSPFKIHKETKEIDFGLANGRHNGPNRTDLKE